MTDFMTQTKEENMDNRTVTLHTTDTGNGKVHVLIECPQLKTARWAEVDADHLDAFVQGAKLTKDTLYDTNRSEDRSARRV